MHRLLTQLRWIVLLSFCTSIDAHDLSLNRNQFYIGPEVYSVRRAKEGGTKQQGELTGIRVGYDRLKRYGWYLGADALYAEGKLKGHSRAGYRLHSHLKDTSYEGRLGYTFQQKCGWQASFTPYIGVGYFQERNNISKSAPLPVHSQISYRYVTAGFLTWFHFCRFEGGLNFKARYPYEPKCYVTHDPENHSIRQRVGDEWQYRLELPLAYRICEEGSWAIGLIPFFEYRNYGEHPNFPFDFIKTNYRIWGATLDLIQRF